MTEIRGISLNLRNLPLRIPGRTVATTRSPTAASLSAMSRTLEVDGADRGFYSSGRDVSAVPLSAVPPRCQLSVYICVLVHRRIVNLLISLFVCVPPFPLYSFHQTLPENCFVFGRSRGQMSYSRPAHPDKAILRTFNRNTGSIHILHNLLFFLPSDAL